MKSIVQEAASIAKAIEKAWLRAEKPQSFSVKILEEPSKNFFGMTTKSAKIAFFFDEEDTPLAAPKPAKQSPKKPHLPKDEVHKKTAHPTKPKPSEPRAEAPKSTEAKHNRPFWSAALVQEAETWVKTILSHMGKSDRSFSTRVKNNHLIFSFSKSVMDSSEQERLLFSSFAHLLMQSLKNKFKHDARGLKIILQSL